jgi:hypothetical protein
MFINKCTSFFKSEDFLMEEDQILILYLMYM